MATISNIGLQGNWNVSNAKKENMINSRKVLEVNFNSSHQNNDTLNNHNKRRFSLVITNSNHGSTFHKVDTINGTKVNGLQVVEAPKKLLNEENTTDVALVTNGRFVEGRFVFRQIFVIRSYEIGPDRTATMETLMNFLQETALNHVTSSGIGGDGFGATREMSLRKLIWVVTRIQVQVQRYNKWGEEIEIDTWVDAAGKNGMRRDWIIRDRCTKEIITKATSTWVIMNRETRRLSKIPEEVRKELTPFYLHKIAVASEERDCEKIDKLTDDTAERIQSGLAPRWNDMDVNQHVNNVKYIGWILESVPIKVLEDYNMTSLTLEFRRECTQSDTLESLTCPTERVIGESDNNSSNRKPDQQYTHLLRLQDDQKDVVRARSEWNLKQNQQ
ncbi:putative oleoyl-[acyl-carrier-protein] hydrolase [Medicago truncatula]|uniref:Acyl-[acyl-carrier-protein] hydrolase n=1 Tax=Medicago truncatula TaxID=3880 RepID=G7J3D9_MEDTR|nr:palmitoyl-acyl carrier protein thioesterase, chloroplastic [Medicago truncatula]AES73040.1 palmitoyl-acyl carrier thioesterase [Medicago truncatula]AFK43036.1 unknown [Medicago truncatula]RHN70109.1 putative oleoyl-[acyl-carrier-protein] hydrolase [Medicago truncatula]